MDRAAGVLHQGKGGGKGREARKKVDKMGSDGSVSIREAGSS